MSKRKHPVEASSRQAQKLQNPSTRGKNAAGQTNGQWEHDPRKRTGQFTQAGDAPMMRK